MKIYILLTQYPIHLNIYFIILFVNMETSTFFNFHQAEIVKSSTVSNLTSLAVVFKDSF